MSEAVQYENHGQKLYIKGSEAEIIRKASVVIKMDSAECSQKYRNRQKDRRLEKWRTKPVNEQHLRQTEQDAAKETCQWVMRGSLKRERV